MEAEARHDDTVAADPWSIVGCAVAGAIAGLMAAAAVGAAYMRTNPDVDCDPLIRPFATYVAGTGALAFGGLRIGLIVAPRWPIVAGAITGALVGIAPGAYGAKTFGALELPFVGSIGFVLAAIPFVVLGIPAITISDGSKTSHALFVSFMISIALALVLAIAFAATRSIHAPAMIDALRDLLFLGLERVGAITGIGCGIVVGGAIGAGVRLARITRERLRP
jgi:hypothetical protein